MSLHLTKTPWPDEALNSLTADVSENLSGSLAVKISLHTHQILRSTLSPSKLYLMSFEKELPGVDALVSREQCNVIAVG